MSPQQLLPNVHPVRMMARLLLRHSRRALGMQPHLRHEIDAILRQTSLRGGSDHDAHRACTAPQSASLCHTYTQRVRMRS